MGLRDYYIRNTVRRSVIDHNADTIGALITQRANDFM